MNKKRIRLGFSIALLTVALLNLSGQEVSRGLGNFKSVKKTAGSWIISASGGCLKLTPYNENMIRVQVSENNTFDEFSYAVIASPVTVKSTVTEKADLLEITSGNIRVQVYKKPVRIVFSNLTGQVLNEDDATDATRFMNGSCFVYKKTFTGERFIGLGEKTGPLDKAGKSYTNWNGDNLGYTVTQDPLYETLPFYMGIHDSLAYGIFLDNSYQTDFCFARIPPSPTFFGVHGGEMNYYFIAGNTVANIVEEYTNLTGKMNLPPLWSLGMHQCRWSYYPDKEVLDIARNYRERSIPADAMTLDIDYMEGYKLFTWNHKYFPDPAGMIAKLKDMKFHTTVILDPGIKIEEGYSAYEDGLKKDVFIKSADGKSYFRGEVWPGMCYFPDFTNPATRTWWGDHLNALAATGVRGFWNDMNEPANWTKMFDPLTLNNFDGHPSTHLRAHNVYGMQMARSSYDGAVKALGERPFVLTRAGYSGVQRYSAVWTGDNVSSDEHMLLGVRLINNLGLAGIPFCGMDVGGFTGYPDQSNELFARFFTIGSFMPFDRLHVEKDTRAQEPWNFGEWVEAIAKKYTEIRYQLLPYLYSTFYEASQTGIPVQRSLTMNYGFDPKIYDAAFENQYFFGPSILVAPVASAQNFAKVYFPDNGYYDFYNDTYYPSRGEYIVDATNTNPVSKLPVFIKAGSIIPMHKVIQSTMDDPGDTLTLHLYKGNAQTSYVYYEDDGISFDYRKGQYYKRLIRYNAPANELLLESKEGDYSSHYKTIRLVFHGFSQAPSSVTVNDQTVNVTVMQDTLCLAFGNDPGKIQVKWR